jgi:hypothetical protein
VWRAGLSEAFLRCRRDVCRTYGAPDSFLRFDPVLADWAHLWRTSGAPEDAALRAGATFGAVTQSLKVQPTKDEKQIPRANTALGMTLAALRLGGAFSGRGIGADLRGDGYSDGVGFDYGGAFWVGPLDADVVFAGGA